MDYTRDAGGAAIGARLRRLSEMIDGDTTRIYASLGVPFEQRWFGVINQLALHGSSSVSEIAAVLRITHASVSQTRDSLERAGLIESRPDEFDARRKNLRLTRAGRRLVERMAPLWSAFETAAAALNAEVGDLARILDRLDDALAKVSMFDRIQAHFPKTGSDRGAGRVPRKMS